MEGFSSEPRHAEDCQEPPGARKREGKTFPRAFRGNIWPLASRTVREAIFVVLSHQVCGNLLQVLIKVSSNDLVKFTGRGGGKRTIFSSLEQRRLEASCTGANLDSQLDSSFKIQILGVPPRNTENLGCWGIKNLHFQLVPKTIQVRASLLCTDTPILPELSFLPYAGKGSRESKDHPVNLFPRPQGSGLTSLCLRERGTQW